MAWTYTKLFNIRVEHTFYESGFSTKDLSIQPSAETTKLLKNRRMLFKYDNFGFKIAYMATVNGTSSPVIPLEDARFTFTMKLENTAEFMNFTKLKAGSDSYDSGNILYFRNDPLTNKNITHELIDYLRPAIFTYEFTLANFLPTGVDVNLEVLDENNITVFTALDIEESNQVYKVPMDFRNMPKGRYTFRVTYDVNTEDKTVYVDNDLVQQDIFGIIDIDYNSTSGDFKSEYDVRFNRRKTRWKYFIVNKSGIDLGAYDLFIEDKSGDTGSPVYDTYIFSGSQSPSPGNSVGGFDTLVFTSTKQIPFYEVPKLKLELIKKDAPGPPPPPGPPPADVTLIKNLPNPVLAGVDGSNLRAEIFVFI